MTPNALKLNTSGQRAPVGIFTVPDRPQDLMHKIEDAYLLWYKVWNVDYVPLIAQRQKWHFEEENLRENDVVYFKLVDSALSSEWHIGKVEYISAPKDGNVRVIGVGYKYDTEDGERKFSIVERPVREVVRLLNVDDTTLLDDIKKVQDAAKKIFDTKKVVSGEELENLQQDLGETFDIQDEDEEYFDEQTENEHVWPS